MDFDEIFAIGFGIFLGVTIAGIFDSMKHARAKEDAELYGKPEHILTSRGRMLLVEVGESNVISFDTPK